VLKLYANELEKNILPVQITVDSLTHGKKSTPVMDVIVTCDDSKSKYVIAVVNKHPDKANDFALDFAGLTGKVPKEVSATLLSGASADDFNDIGAENRVIPIEKILKVTNGKITIPAHTVGIVRIGN
jgi:alpha-N-arabinofuranosidase